MALGTKLRAALRTAGRLRQHSHLRTPIPRHICSVAAPFDGLFDAETASLPLRVAKVPEAGNGVLASKGIKYGEIILAEKPRLVFPTSDRLHSVCYHCLTNLPEPESTPIAGGHTFCSDTCVAAAQSSFLNVEEAADMASLRQHCDDAGERFPLLAARLACEVIQHEATQTESRPKEAPDEWLHTLCFVSTPDVPKQWEDSWYVMAAALMGVKGAVPGVTLNKLQWLLKERIGLQWFADVVSRLHLNVFKVTYPRPLSPDGFVSLRDLSSADLTDMMGSQGGTAAYRLSSMFNHSCEPNVNVNFPYQDSELVLTAARDIDEGEQLFISYIDATQGFTQRQKHLKWAYGFKCQCPLCTDEAGEKDQ